MAALVAAAGVVGKADDRHAVALELGRVRRRHVGQDARALHRVSGNAVSEIAGAADKAQRLRDSLVPSRSTSPASSAACAEFGGGPLRCATMATTGEAISMTSGMTTAAARIRRVSMSRMATAGGDNSSTGSSVQADIDHSEVISMPLTSAATAGSSKGAQNAAATRRRSESAGQSMSVTVARFARAATSTASTGIAT